MRGKERTMTTIIINAITHRQACTDALGEEDLQAYDRAAAGFFENLRKAAEAEGFEFEVDAHGQGGASYRVVEDTGSAPDYAEYERAHLFMQSPVADFWVMYK
jgi:hypothetical protein